MDRILSKVENAWCSVDHGDEYVKAKVFCCSCEVYYCDKCDAEKHKQSEEDQTTYTLNINEQEMHIRIPVDQVIGDDDEEHIVKDDNDKKKLHEEQEKAKNIEKKADILKELENEKKEKEKREKELEKEKEKKEKEKEKKDKEKGKKDKEKEKSEKIKEKLDSSQNGQSPVKLETEGTIFEEDIENVNGTTTNEMIFNQVKGTNSCALEEDEVDAPEEASQEDQLEAAHVVQGVFEGLIELGSGIGDGVTGIIADPMAGAKEGGAKGFFKGVGKGLSGVALKPVKGASGFILKTAEGLRNTPETIFTPKNQHIDIVKEKEASHLLDGLYQGTLGLGKGIFEGVTGIIAEPVRGVQEQGGKGFFVGLGKGLMGVVLKPISGAMEFVSKPIEGLANTPQTIIDAIETKKAERQAKANAANANRDLTSSDEILDAAGEGEQINKKSSLSSASKSSPSLGRFNKSKEEDLQSQKEYNEKWLERNQVLSNNSISSIDFKRQ
ncbi:hypothetical protein PPL_12360 [Heterostelium album PN500]|uniref:Uncharacterized protein n=1 Tax=Heterostelium pallidum (strain ATCC 26659 / Pp 5 / PN500) TaxID=670386 RepID=D3BME0_HETP5|nr:hypothetical protein PPL_12360 [Heterostelium album PN500]EFA77152.1 hypothetical protein PPL_12360 [Heterostelium album PN500]|eukprot:XP_020429281.1 hypothetical protein PPL_12360 [Heterostelium album PN500]